MMMKLKTINFFLRNWCIFLTNAIRLKLMSRASIEIENQALRSQLTLFQQQLLNHKIPKPQTTPAFRQLWVLISKLCSNWRSFLVVKPETVIGTRARAGIVPHFDFIGHENPNLAGDRKSLKQQLP